MSLTRILAVCMLSSVLAAPAFASPCAGLEGKKLEKCEAKEAKKAEKEVARIAKLRASTTPFLPSKVHPDLANLDEAAVNPLNSDEFYVGYKETGLAQVDEVLIEATRVMATVKMANWVGKVNQDGDGQRATKVATVLLPELIKLQDSVPTIQAKVQEIISNPTSVVQDDPMAALKVPKALGGVAGQLPKALSELPQVISAIEPIAKGAAAAGVNMATEKAAEAVAP